MEEKIMTSETQRVLFNGKLSPLNIPFIWVNSRHPALIVFVILCCFYLSFIPNNNEEMYFFAAKISVQQDWIDLPSERIEDPGPKIVYNYIIGHMLQIMSFESLTFVLRLSLILIVSVFLGELYKFFKIKNIAILFQLSILFLPNQSLFARSWMFIFGDAQGIAWVLAVVGLYCLSKYKFNFAIIIAVLMTYMHVIIGLYFGLILLATIAYINYKNQVLDRMFIGSVLLFAVPILPYFLFLMDVIVVHNELSPDPNWIYTYFRHPHHTALFTNAKHFYGAHFFGIIYTILGLLFLLFAKNEYQKKNISDVILVFTIISIIFTLVLVPIIFFDKNGVLLKFYPYRMNTLSTFLLTLYFMKWMYSRVKSNFRNELDALFFISIFSLVQVLGQNVSSNIKAFAPDNALNAACLYIKHNTQRSDVVLNLSGQNKVMRKSERPIFSSFKFVPSQLDKIHDWYFRVIEQNRIANDISLLNDVRKSYRIDYILSEESYDDCSNSQLVFKNDEYYVYMLQKLLGD
jgi:hypothetical protein